MRNLFLRHLFGLVMLGFGASSVLAQTATIRGNVYDKETGEPILYGNVILRGTTIGTNTDLDGFFTLSGLEPGDYQVVVTYIGYDSVSTPVNVRANEVKYLKLYMEGSGIQLQTVDVSGRRSEQKTEVYVSKIKVTPKQIQALPSTGAEADLVQYLQVLPGVITSGDQGGQLYIRGGAPIQNKILLDGMTIYNPFHSIGFFSVFETEAIKSVDVLTGGFDARYGGRISAIVDIKTREGNRSRFSGLVSGSPFQAKALIEGPIIRFEEGKNVSASFLLTGKHSYLDQTSPTLYDYATDSLGLPYTYTDIFGKVSLLSGNGSKINLFGFNFDDGVNFPGVARLNWRSSGGGLDFRLIPGQSRLVVGGNVSWSKYEINLAEADEEPRMSGINGFTVALDFTYFGQNNELNYGFEVNGFRTDFEFRNFVGVTIDQFNNTTEIGGYAKYRIVSGPLILEPSVRLMFYASLSNFSLEPRFALKYAFSDRFRFKMSGGFYSQNLISTVNDLDIVNLFVGFLSGPEEQLFLPASTTPANHKIQKAVHGIAGFEIDLAKGIQFNVEPYYKRFSQLINVNRNKLSQQDPDFATETGDAYGIDFSARYDAPGLSLWGTYSYGFVQRDDGEQTYYTNFDRRHNINLVGSYAFGRNDTWEFGIRWNYGSGFPFTLTQGFYGRYNFLQGLDTDVLTENPDLGILFDDERNAGRLPDYHRLDISLKKRIEISRNVLLEVTASVTNVYDRENIFYFDRIRFQRVDQLPILPSIGMKLQF